METANNLQNEEGEWKTVTILKKEKPKSSITGKDSNRKEFASHPGKDSNPRLVKNKVESRPKPSSEAKLREKQNESFAYSKAFQIKEEKAGKGAQANLESSVNEPTQTKIEPLKPKPKEKSKPQKNVALFDVLMSSQTANSNKRNQSLELSNDTLSRPKLHSNAARNLEVTFEPKNFVFQEKKKNKRKKVSALKKKVLKERLRIFIRRKLQQQIEEKQKEWNRIQSEHLQKKQEKEQQYQQRLEEFIASTRNITPVPMTIRLYNFTNQVDWTDEDEKDEIITNIKDLLSLIFTNHQQLLASSSSSSSSSSSFSSMISPSLSSMDIFQFLSNLSIRKMKSSFYSLRGLESFQAIFDQEESNDWLFSYIDIRFQYKELAELYLQLMDSMVVGGDKLKVVDSVTDQGDYLKELLRQRLHEYHQRRQQQEERREENEKQEISQQQQTLLSDQGALNSRENENQSFTILLDNIINEEDVEDMDDVQEILNDIYSLCKAKQLPDFLWIEKRKLDSFSSSPLYHSTPLAMKDYSAMIYYSSRLLKESFEIYELFDGKNHDQHDFRILWKDLFPRKPKIPTELIEFIDFRSTTSREGSFMIEIHDFVSFEEYEDEDERYEIISNILSLLDSSTPSSSSLTDSLVDQVLFLRSESSDNMDSTDDGLALSVFILFSSNVDQKEIVHQFHHLQTQIIAGNSLSLELLFLPSASHVQQLKETVLSDELPSSCSLLPQYSHLITSFRANYLHTLAVVSDYFDEKNWFADDNRPADEDNDETGNDGNNNNNDDDDGAGGNEESDQQHSIEIRMKEEFVGLLQDKLSHRLRGLVSLTFPRKDQVDNDDETKTSGVVDEMKYLICLQFHSFATMQPLLRSLFYFDGLMLGGKEVIAYFDPLEEIDMEREKSVILTEPTGEEKGGEKPKKKKKNKPKPSNSTRPADANKEEKEETDGKDILFEYQVPTVTNEDSNALSTTTTKEAEGTKNDPIHFEYQPTIWQQHFECVYFEYFFPSASPADIAAVLPTLLIPLPTEKISSAIENEADSLLPPPPQSSDITREALQIEETQFLSETSRRLRQEQQQHQHQQEQEQEQEVATPAEDSRLVSVYKAAKTLPKAGFHDKPMNSSIPVANEEINVIIKKFLSQLTTFQDRLRQQYQPPPGSSSSTTMSAALSKQYKAKLRYLLGMKQIKSLLSKTYSLSVASISLLKQQKCRLLLIAPNTELSEEIDSKLNEIIELAKVLEIPICYCLSKKLLAKALGMSMKQTMVAILDPNGVFDLFKKIIAFIETGRSY